MKLVLDIKSPEKSYKKEIVLSQIITFGRNTKSQFSIADDQISSAHLQITFNQNGLYIQDLNSKNGTFINNMRVETSKFYLGDNVKIGSTSIIINPDNMDDKTKEFLTYKGDKKNRTAYGLKLDFAGIGKNNPEGPQVIGDRTIIMEMRKPKPRKYSKKELRQKHKALASFASTLDLFFGIGMIALSLLASYLLIVFIPEYLRGHKLTFTFSLVLLSFFSFYFYNFKKSSFTLGERIVGLKDMFLKQY